MEHEQVVALLKANHDKLARTFANLASRWEDEKEYEDIEGYLSVLKDILAESIKEATHIKTGKWFVRFKLGGFRAEYSLVGDKVSWRVYPTN